MQNKIHIKIKSLEARVNEVLTRGVVDVIEKEHLFKRITSEEKLRIKLGIDPTGPNLHLGKGATIRKLREFQDLGHQIVLIIGDATAQIGDTSDKYHARKMLSHEEIKQNEKHYLDQIGKIIDISKTEIHHNSEWISKLTPNIWVNLASLFTFQQMLERDNFSERLKKNDPIGWHEGLYCLLQGYDSVNIKADVEIGGTDQLFNLQAGRRIQKYFGQPPQDIMTHQLLAGTDGRKMSTTWGNTILIIDPPEEKYGRIMSIADYLIPVYMECATLIPMARVVEVSDALEAGKGNPMDYKKELAFEIVKLYDGINAAKKAAVNFKDTIQNKKIPLQMPEYYVQKTKLTLQDMIAISVKANLVKSKSESRRLLEEGGIYVNNKQVMHDSRFEFIIPNEGLIVRFGKRKYLKIKYQAPR